MLLQHLRKDLENVWHELSGVRPQDVREDGGDSLLDLAKGPVVKFDETGKGLEEVMVECWVLRILSDLIVTWSCSCMRRKQMHSASMQFNTYAL